MRHFYLNKNGVIGSNNIKENPHVINRLEYLMDILYKIRQL